MMEIQDLEAALADLPAPDHAALSATAVTRSKEAARTLGLSDPEARQAGPGANPVSGQIPLLNAPDLLRAHSLIAITDGLGTLFDDAEAMQRWLRGSHRGTGFDGRAPIELLLSGRCEDMVVLREHVASRLAGHPAGHGAAEGSYEAVGRDDLSWE